MSQYMPTKISPWSRIDLEVEQIMEDKLTKTTDMNSKQSALAGLDKDVLLSPAILALRLPLEWSHVIEFDLSEQ